MRAVGCYVPAVLILYFVGNSSRVKCLGKMYGIPGNIAAGDGLYKMLGRRKTGGTVYLTKYHYRESVTQNGSA